MIAFFRRALSSWVVLAFLGLIMVAFIITGVSAPGSLGGQGSGESIARIGREKLSSAELIKRTQQQFDQARAEQPGLDIGTFLKSGGLDQTADSLIAAKSLNAWGAKHGFAVSERMIDAEVASISAFHGPTGSFDATMMKAALSQKRITEKQLREDIRADLIRRQLLLPVAGNDSMPRAMALPYASMLLESREGLVGIVPVAAIPQGPAPGEAEIAAAYKAGISRYTMAERRVLRYALFDATLIGEKATPTEADIAAFYKANAASYAASETRTLTQVILPDEAAAKAFIGKVKSGATMAVAAKAAGLDPVTLNDQTEKSFAATANAAIAKASFAVAQGGLGGPVKGDFGWYVVRVDSTKAIAGRRLDMVRADITAELTKQKRDEALSDLVTKIEESIADGSSYDDVIKANNLTAMSTPPLLQNGAAPDVPTYAAPPEVRLLLKTAFETSPDEDPTVETIGTGEKFAVLAVQQVLPATPIPLAKVRADVIRDLQLANAAKKAKTLAEQIVASTRKGAPLAAAIALSGVRLPAPQRAGARQLELAQARGPVPAPLKKLFTMKPGTTELVEAPNGQGWFVVQLGKITPGDASTMPPLIDATRAELTRASQTEIVEQFVNATQKELGVTRDAAAIARVRKELAGGSAQ